MHHNGACPKLDPRHQRQGKEISADPATIFRCLAQKSPGVSAERACSADPAEDSNQGWQLYAQGSSKMMVTGRNMNGGCPQLSRVRKATTALPALKQLTAGHNEL